MRIPFRTGRIASVLALVAGSLLSSSVLAPPAQAAISFTKSVDKATVSPGETVTYTLRYTCSITECTNGRILDTLPSNMQFVGWTPDPSSVDAAASTVPAGGAMGGSMDIKLKNLSPGTTATITVTMKYPNFTTPNGTTSTNSATMSATGETSQTSTANTKAQVQPQYTVTKGIQTSSSDGRTVTYQFSACATDNVPNVDLDTSRLLDTLPPGVVVDTGRSPGWAQVAPGPNTWGYDIGAFTSGNGRGGCRNPGVLVVHYPEADFPDGTTSDNNVDLLGAPLTEAERKLDSASTTTGQFRPPATGVVVTASKVWRDTTINGDLNSFSISATNTSGPATSLTITDPGAGSTDGVYNWIYPQSIQLEPWNPNSIGLTLQYRLNGDPTWQTFTPTSPFNGSTARRITFVQGAGDPSRDELGIPAGRWLDGLKFTWNGPIPTGWSPGNAVQVVTQVATPGHDGRTAPTPLTNCVDTTATDGTNNASANACASTTITQATNLGAAKTTVAGELSAPGGMATFQVIPYNRSARDLDRPLVLYDVLPAGVVYVDGSARPDPNYPDAKAPTSVTVTPGPDGRQILRMAWPAGAPDMTYLHDPLAYRMLFDVQVASSVRPGRLTNDVYVTVDQPTAPVACMFSGSDSGSTPDVLDLNGNGDTTELMCHASSNIQVDAPAALRSYKEVKGDLDADYVSIGTATPGGRISYRMTVRNDSPDPVTGFIAYDELPTPGDNYVLTQDAARGSAWTPSLSQPITSSDPTVVIEYTTDPNPCVETALVTRTGCNAAAAWSAAFPGPGTATWFRVHRAGAMAPGESFALTWPMVASYDAPEGDYAWNSFAFTATDNEGRQLLPAEPAKVGVAVKVTAPTNNALGDFVWQDLDGSGIQQPGEPGIPGVTVNLLDGNGQPVRDKNGKPVTTVTDATGHYLFDNLPDGSYQVQFDLTTLPTGATVTKRGAGTDPAKDSDADPATGLTQVVTLKGGQRDLDLDMGVILRNSSPSPSPSPSPTHSPSPSPSPSPTHSPSPSPTNSPSPTPTPTSPSPTTSTSGTGTPPVSPTHTHSHTHSPSSSASGGTLPHTGSSSPNALIAALGAIAVLGGGALLLVAYRRPGRHS
ncbi:SdrD B-like domain-containing protein [Kitasatospora sp. NPDC094028]